jgi:methyl-accepting chemotaxis protein
MKIMCSRRGGASEVKTLARQTAQATEEISKEIAAMRATTARTAEIVGGMSSTIRALSQLSDQLSGHAEELAGSVDQLLQTIRNSRMASRYASRTVATD